MDETDRGIREAKGLRSRHWLLSYRTSSTLIDGRPVDMLHDFYIPALSLSIRYDRVAGYFRSSSLAAASQGFSAFVGRQGRMRLIVGADLDPEDVKAILRGDSERLAANLNGELERAGSWPQSVRDGVTLLAWMVAHGRLEVRVAFRVHGETGEPLPFGAVDDGYVHEKWFILQDELGNRLYGAGTLNESRTALVLNAENVDIHCDWWGETDRRRVDEAEEAFERLWNDRVRHLRVMTLPEAVRQRLIRLADGIERPLEVDGTSAAPRVVEPPSALERLRFAILRDAPKMPGGRYVGMETAPVAPWPHQAVVVRRLIDTWPFSYLLCDEVGLGKTIEAGLAFRSLYLSGLAGRILVAAPPSLTRQWHRQMATKLLMSFGLARTRPEVSHDYIFPAEETKKSASIYEPDLVIMSTGLLAREERAAALKDARPFDVVLVDEAHGLRRRNPSAGVSADPDFGHLYTSVREHLRPMAKSLWLATATPMQIDPVEVCDLIALTNRVGAFQFDPSLALEYYRVMRKILHGEEPEPDEWEFLRRSVRAVRMQDPPLWRFVEAAVFDRRLESAARRWLDYGLVPRGRDRELLTRVIFSAAPASRVMMRHTRKLLEIYRQNGKLKENLARRIIRPIPRIVFTPDERRAYESLEDYCRGLNNQIRIAGDSQAIQMARFLLGFFRLRFASSLYAVRETLKRRLAKVEATLSHTVAEEEDESDQSASSLQEAVWEGEDEGDEAAVGSLLRNRSQADLEWERERLRQMLNDMAGLQGPSSKMQVLFGELDRRRDPATGRIRQMVVFTRFYDTLTDIVAWLRRRNPTILVGTYSGRGAEYFDPARNQMVSAEREEVRERFLRGEIDVLVCTDAAAEGLNLQTADFLVNFDLGWNPMKVEQRIGRIDRIGQKHEEVYVLNLCYADSAEEIVYGRLLSRLAQAGMIVGTQQISLLPVEPEDFRQLAEGSLTPEELELKALERLKLQRQQAEAVEMSPEEVYSIYMRLDEKEGPGPAPVDLHAIWKTLSGSRYLRDHGCTVGDDPSAPTLTLHGISGVPEGAVLTVSRELYERGSAGGGSRVHFASYGDPCFEALLAQVGRYEMPPCIRRICTTVPELDGVEMVGYAVVCTGPEGTRQVRLVKRWADLEGLEVLEHERLSEDEVEAITKTLEEIARSELNHHRVAARIERDNLRAARGQKALSLLVARSLLEARGRYAGDGGLFGPVLREVQSLFEQRPQIIASDLPARVIRPVVDDFLFDVSCPSLGANGHAYVSRILARSAIDAAAQLADSMKVRKSELVLKAVLARLEREIERWTRWQPSSGRVAM